MVMFLVNVAEIKAKLSEYLERAVQGERIVICRHNKPVAELRAVDRARIDPRPIGPLPGRPTFELPAAFFEPMTADELEAWEGAEDGARGSRVAEDNSRYDAPDPAPRRRPR